MMVFGRASMGARNNIIKIALGLYPNWQGDQKGHCPDHREQNKTGGDTHRSDLLKLDQRAVEILGVQEQYRLAMRANLGLAGTQNPCTGGF
tara:strand:- start:1 stop:273 length:273 start_codon:yes stop_codon:yes gene_type:complete